MAKPGKGRVEAGGKAAFFFGNRLLWQEPGEAFLIPPNYKVPHASINHTEEPMLWLYMGCRHEEDASDSGSKAPAFPPARETLLRGTR